MFPSMKMDERLEYEFFDIFPAKLVLSLSLSLSLSFSLSFSSVMSLSEQIFINKAERCLKKIKDSKFSQKQNQNIRLMFLPC